MQQTKFCIVFIGLMGLRIKKKKSIIIFCIFGYSLQTITVFLCYDLL